MLRASVNCYCAPCSVNDRFIMIRINVLFVSSLRIKTFCSVSTSLCRGYGFVAIFFRSLHTFSTRSPCPLFSPPPPTSSRPPPSEARGSAECNAADGHADWRGIRDEVPHRNGLRPQTTGRTQGKAAGGRRCCRRRCRVMYVSGLLHVFTGG